LADLLGPSGQPLSPNPFTQSQQGMSANVSVNTQPAERAFADLQKVLDGLMKNFGVNWEKASHDGMAAQERFYSYIGDKQKERELALKRYSSEAISGIEKERDAAIAALDAKKMAHEDFEKEKTRITDDAEKARKKIGEETDRKRKQSSGVMQSIAKFAGDAGGPFGGAISSQITSMAEHPIAYLVSGAIMAGIEKSIVHAQFTRAGAGLAGAGFRLGAGASTAEAFDRALFGPGVAGGRFGAALSRDQQVQIMAQMAGSRTMIDQARGGGFGAISGNLGLFANILPDASKEMEIFTDATKDLGMSQKDITNTFVSSRVNADRLKITQLDAIATQMDMARALRNVTNDGVVAANVLYNITGYLNAIGASESEKIRIAGAVGQAGANLSFQTLYGMSTFLNDGKRPTFEGMFGTGAYGVAGSKVGIMHDPFKTLGGFLTKIGGQFHDPNVRMLVASQLMDKYVPGLRMQDIPQFFNLAAAAMRGDKGIDYGKEFEKLEKKTPQIAMAEGINTLVQIVAPIVRLENVFTNFWPMIDERINKLFDHFGIDTIKGLPKKMMDWVDMNIKHKGPAGGASGTY